MVNKKSNFFIFCLTERILIERKIDWTLSLFGNVNLEDENGEFLRHLSSKLFVKIKRLNEALKNIECSSVLNDQQINEIKAYLKILNWGVHSKKNTYVSFWNQHSSCWDSLLYENMDILQIKNNIFKLCSWFQKAINGAISDKDENKYRVLTNRGDFQLKMKRRGVFE